jgi:hypothetical protein
VALVLCVFHLASGQALADPVRAWPQPGGSGSPVVITYSYSNLLEGDFLATPEQLRAATEEALRLWASVAPLHFIERPDSGPLPSDASYAPADHPQIRIGYRQMDELALAFGPGWSDGLEGDVHVNGGIPWSLGTAHWNFLEAITHELGHSLGLEHEISRPAIMNPSYPQRRFFGLGTAFLLPPDIQAIRSLYGRGTGSVVPLVAAPEPATLILTAGGVIMIGMRRMLRRRYSNGP